MVITSPSRKQGDFDMVVTSHSRKLNDFEMVFTIHSRKQSDFDMVFTILSQLFKGKPTDPFGNLTRKLDREGRCNKTAMRASPTATDQRSDFDMVITSHSRKQHDFDNVFTIDRHFF